MYRILLNIEYYENGRTRFIPRWGEKKKVKYILFILLNYFSLITITSKIIFFCINYLKTRLICVNFFLHRVQYHRVRSLILATYFYISSWLILDASLLRSDSRSSKGKSRCSRAAPLTKVSVHFEPSTWLRWQAAFEFDDRIGRGCIMPTMDLWRYAAR